jgi:hypothetical protein
MQSPIPWIYLQLKGIWEHIGKTAILVVNRSGMVPPATKFYATAFHWLTSNMNTGREANS